MKRVLTKVAGIIDTILYGFLTAGFSLLFGLVLAGSAYLAELDLSITGTGMMIFIAFLITVVFIISLIGLIFSVKSISYSHADKETYKSKYSIFIANAIFNFMFALMYALFVGGSSILSNALFACFILCGVFYIIDMAKNKNIQEENIGECNSTNDTVNQEQSQDKNNKVNIPYTLEAQLKKLSNLKEQNLITEKEYSALREKLINKELENNN